MRSARVAILKPCCYSNPIAFASVLSANHFRWASDATSKAVEELHHFLQPRSGRLNADGAESGTECHVVACLDIVEHEVHDIQGNACHVMRLWLTSFGNKDVATRACNEEIVNERMDGSIKYNITSRETSQVVKTTGLDLEAKLNHDVGQESQDGPGKCAEMSNENPLNELHVTC